MNKFLIFLVTIIAIIATTPLVLSINAYAQQQTPPPPLEEKPTEEATPPIEPSSSFGKITIQISQTEQIIIDLPIKSDNKYQVLPIK